MSFLVTEADKNREIDARDFNNIETSALITFFPESADAKENHAILIDSLGEYGTLYTTVNYWVVQFKLGNFSTGVASCPGRHKTVTTPNLLIILKSYTWKTGGFQPNQ